MAASKKTLMLIHSKDFHYENKNKEIGRTNRMNWITCQECEEEFRIVTDSLAPITYCPLCGADLPEGELEDEFDDE